MNKENEDLRFIVAAILKNERLKRKAKSKTWSQTYLASLVNEKYGTTFTKQSLGLIETGKKISFDSAAKIADVLEINWQEKFKEYFIGLSEKHLSL